MLNLENVKIFKAGGSHGLAPCFARGSLVSASHDQHQIVKVACRCDAILKLSVFGTPFDCLLSFVQEGGCCAACVVCCHFRGLCQVVGETIFPLSCSGLSCAAAAPFLFKLNRCALRGAGLRLSFFLWGVFGRRTLRTAVWCSPERSLCWCQEDLPSGG